MDEAGHGTDATGPRASFWLVPANLAAEDAVNSYAAWNEGFTQWYTDPEDPDKQIAALHIQFYGYEGGQAVSVGRQSQSSSDRVANILLPPEKHSSSDRPRQQCEFRFNNDTGAVVLRDLTSREHVRIDTANRWQKEVPFSVEHGGGRQVLISRDFNGRLSIGKNSDLVFNIDWDLDALYTWFGMDDIHVGPRENDQYRYVQGNDIGSGSYGTVFKAVDVYTGKAMAVKRYRGLEDRRGVLAWREVTHLKSLRHKHILSILDFECGPSWMEMFMPLMNGSLKDLIKYHSSQLQLDIEHVATRVLYQMLQALDFLHSGTSQRPVIIHRDIKPANILYRWRQDDFDFFLADFGVAHLASLANTENVGTQAYRAPEVAIARGRQTPKVDIWSLFVTIAWVWNDDNFRDKCEGSTSESDSTVTEIAKLPRYRKLRNMVQLKPENRPTASNLLSSLRPDKKTQTFPGLWKWAGQESGDDSGFSDDYVGATGSNDYAPDHNSGYPQQTTYPEGHDTGYGGDTTNFGASGYYGHASSAGGYPGYNTNPGAATSGYYPYVSSQYGAGSSAPRYVESGSGQAADPAMSVTGGMNSLTLGDYNQFDAGPSAGSSSGPQHRTESRDDRKASKGKKKSSSTRR